MWKKGGKVVVVVVVVDSDSDSSSDSSGQESRVDPSLLLRASMMLSYRKRWSLVARRCSLLAAYTCPTTSSVNVRPEHGVCGTRPWLPGNALGDSSSVAPPHTHPPPADYQGATIDYYATIALHFAREFVKL